MACNSVHSCDLKTYDMKYVITSLKHDYQCRTCHIRLSRTQSLNMDCHNVRYPSKAHLRFKPNEISFFHISSHPFMLPNHFQIVHRAWQYHIWEICYSRTSFRKAWFRIRFAGISCITHCITPTPGCKNGVLIFSGFMGKPTIRHHSSISLHWY